MHLIEGVIRAEVAEELSEDKSKGDNHSRVNKRTKGQDPFHAMFRRAVFMAALSEILLPVPLVI